MSSRLHEVCEDPRGLSDAVIAIEKLLQVIQNSQGIQNYVHTYYLYVLPIHIYIEREEHAGCSVVDGLFVDSAGTIARLRDEIKTATKMLIAEKTSTVSVSSGSELFLRFITLTSLEQTVRLVVRNGRCKFMPACSSICRISTSAKDC